MTCIVSWIDKDKTVWMGGDSVITAGDSRWILPRPKIIRYRNMLIGFVGTLNNFNPLRFKLDCPVDINGDMEPEEYLFEKFLPAVNKVIEKKEETKNGNHCNECDNNECCLLVGFRGRVFCVNPYENGVYEDARNYCVLGCGDVAFGYLASLPQDADPEAALLKAMEIATELTIGVGPPFHIRSLPYKGK